MIRFNCPHCGNEFAVRDTYAGRDGWCRVCKELVLVPTEDGKGPHLDDLPVEDRLSRLRAKLKYAATQADTYKQIALRIWTEVDALLLGRDNKDRKLTPEGIEESLAAWRAALDTNVAKAAPPPSDAGELSRLQADVSGLQTALEKKSRAFAEANAEAERLRAAVAALEAEQARTIERAVTVPDGSVSPEDAAGLREELRTARNALSELKATMTDTESALNAIRAELAAAQSEREDAQRARRVLQDEVESLRVELDAALYATSGEAQAGNDAGEKIRADLIEAQGREAALRADLTETRLKLAELDARKADAEGSVAAVVAELAQAQAERDEARRAARVLQDEAASLRVELDAALHAAAEVYDNGAGAGGKMAVADDGNAMTRLERGDDARDGAMLMPNMPAWREAPVVIAPAGGTAVVSSDEMEVVEAEIEGLDPFENDAMMASYLHFLSDAPGRGK